MRYLLGIIFCHFYCFCYSAFAANFERPAEPFFSPFTHHEGIIDGVNVVSGIYLEHDVDFVTKGIDPYVFERYYCRESVRPEIYQEWDAPNVLGWYMCYDRSLYYHLYSLQYLQQDLMAAQKTGTFMHFDRGGWEGSFTAATLKGYMNHTAGVLSGQNHLCNQRFEEVDRNTIKQFFGDGTVRSFWKRATWDDLTISHLFEERKPSGNRVEIDSDSMPARALGADIRTYSSGGKLLNWVSIHSDDEGYSVKNSDNRSYRFNCGERLSRVSGEGTYLLHHVARPDGNVIFYKYCQRLFHPHTDFLMAKNMPDGRFVNLEYYGNKVKYLLAPLGADDSEEIKYHFKYWEDCTDVYDANGAWTRYTINDAKRITEIVQFYDHHYRKEKNVWNRQGSLVAKVLEDSHGNIHLARHFQYDGRANVTCEKVYGILKGTNFNPVQCDSYGEPEDRGADCYEKRYTYSEDGFNLLLSETDGLATTRYTYCPNTNLLSSKFIYDGSGKICRRQFRYYSDGAFLREIIEDDGNNEDKNYLESSSFKKAIIFKSKEDWPGRGQPETREEWFFDFEVRRDILFQRCQYYYNQHNECIREEIFDGDGNFCYKIERSYDAMGRCISESDPAGNVVTRQYDANGNLLKETGPRADVTVEHGYDYSNRRIWTRKSDGFGTQSTTRFRYDLVGNLISQTDGSGNETRYTYDALGREISVTYPPVLDENDHFVTHTSHKRYDIADNIIDSFNERNEQIQTFYTIRGQPYKINNLATGAQENFEYDLRGNLVKKIETDGSFTCFSYDFLDRLIQTEHFDPDKHSLSVTTTEYTAFFPVKITDANGVVTTIGYDYFGREYRVVCGSKEIQKRYDNLGFLSSVKEFYDWSPEAYTITCFVNDPMGRKLEECVKDASGTTYLKKSYRYDGAGNCVEVVDHLSESLTATRFFTFDGFGREVERRDPLGNVYTTQYLEGIADGFGGVGSYSQETGPEGHFRESFYDARGRLIKEICSDINQKVLSQKQCRYDGVGNKTLVKWEQTPCNWQEVRYSYAFDGKVTEVIEPDGRVKTRFEYDRKGQLIGKTTPTACHSFDYDVIGQVRKHTATNAETAILTTYEYDGCGRVTLIDQNGKQTVRQYDENGNVTYERQESGSEMRYAYDRQGRRTKMSLPDGKEVSYSYLGPFLHQVQCGSYVSTYEKRDLSGKISKHDQLEYAYDLAGRLVKLTCADWNQKAVYSPCGNITSMETRGKADYFSYDGLQQLISENGREYAYDGVENRKGASVGPCNQLLKHNEDEFDYDFEGRVVKSQAFECRYDPLDRMICYNDTRYDYDGLNRRIARNEEAFLYDGNREIGRINAQGQVIELRILGESRGAELGATLFIQIKGTWYKSISDIRGNVACLIDGLGKEVASYHYSAFGEIETTSSIANPWRFQSKRQDSESGWFFFGRRYYCPTTGRFTTPDPLGYSVGPNLYAFVHNNPLTHVELYGFRDEVGPGVNTRQNPVLEMAGWLFRAFMSTVEWIGKNLIPIPGARDVVEGIGRWGSGGKLFETAEYHDNHCQIVRIPGRQILDVTVIFMNGMWTSLEEAKLAAEELSKKHGNIEVFLLYNATNGFITDFLECVFLRLGGRSPAEKMLIDFVGTIQKSSPNELIIMNGHSQAGIVMNNGGHRLTAEERSRIEVVTYATGKIIPHDLFGDVKNHMSPLDWIPMNDIFSYNKAKRERSEHVIFHKPASNNPIKEHMFMEKTCQSAVEYSGSLFIERFFQ